MPRSVFFLVASQNEGYIAPELDDQLTTFGPTLIGAIVFPTPRPTPNPVATTSGFMDIGCALSTRPHLPSCNEQAATRVRIEGDYVLFEVEDGVAMASNDAISIDLSNGMISQVGEGRDLGESCALLVHEMIDVNGTRASSAHWSQNGVGGVDLLVAGFDPEEIPSIARIHTMDRIGPDSNWGGNHVDGEESSLILNDVVSNDLQIHDGEWAEGDLAFIGFRMKDADGKTLYGWVELSISSMGVTVQRFAYDRSGASIHAGTAA